MDVKLIDTCPEEYFIALRTIYIKDFFISVTKNLRLGVFKFSISAFKFKPDNTSWTVPLFSNY